MSYGYQTAAPDRYDILKEFAKQNRKNMTPSEQALWNALRKSLGSWRFRRQHPIGDYIADFICLSEKLVVEVDGEYHNTEEQRIDDKVRTHSLRQMGFRVIRFSNQEVDADIISVIRRIKEELTKDVTI
jgi:very-short-patch-repair endonuclease